MAFVFNRDIVEWLEYRTSPLKDEHKHQQPVTMVQTSQRRSPTRREVFAKKTEKPFVSESRNQSASESGSTNRSFPRLFESPKEQTASDVRLTRRQHENSERRNANMSHYGRRADEKQTEIGEMREGRRQLGRLEVSTHTATVETGSQLERNEARMKMVSMLRDCPTWQKKT